MPGISSLGIGSGLDLSGLVQKLVAAEAQPRTLEFDRREANIQAELSALGVFKSALSDFKVAQQGLLSFGALPNVSAESGDANLYTATAGENAQVGQHSIEVQRLAASQRLASKAFSSASELVGSGTLTFRFGTYDSGTNTFTPNSGKSVQTVVIDPANNTVSAIRDAVNTANIGVRASIVDDGTGQRLVFSSLATGAENSLEITVSNDLDGNDQDDTGLSQLAYDPSAAGVDSGKNLTETVAAKDALLVVDGLSVTRPENTVEGVIQGVTLELKSASPGSTTNLTIKQDPEKTSSLVNQFVENFNKLITSLDQLSHYNSETRQAGPLFGSSAVRSIESKIRNILSNGVAGLSGGVVSLADIGIRTQSDGTLKLDSAKLAAALAADPNAVARLFSSSGQVTDSLLRFSGSQDASIPGQYSIEITQLATRGAYSGAPLGSFPVTVDNSNDHLSIRVDGVDSGPIALTQGSYNSGKEIAAELQNRINSDAALAAAGVSVRVAFQSGRLEITSDRYGSASSVEITEIGTGSSSSLGISLGAGTSGVDVAGSINGVQAEGSGQTLKGTGNAAGLSIDVLGGALGDRGNLSFSRGVSAQFDALVARFLDKDSTVDSRISRLQHNISDIEEQRLRLNRQLTSYQDRLTSQFTALDNLLGQLQATSNFLTQQLSNLPGFGKSISQ
ncbi:MAG: flagellar filament capping protein FliD [Gammaproteobacteria bacterium]